ncbi:hypothetical protein [uncultured Caulobacter sp.]|uniref:hypothetical protein n=1 Tax=uncultured Caulobacter sp. TaxID=158749 RepID=UPI0026299941|nr:hypothetical protein [uncultured Caulobacter sp.]
MLAQEVQHDPLVLGGVDDHAEELLALGDLAVVVEEGQVRQQGLAQQGLGEVGVPVRDFGFVGHL